MTRKKRKSRKHTGPVPTTIRFCDPVNDALRHHAKATGMSASWVANLMIMAGHHATAGNVSGVNAARKLLNSHALAYKQDEAAKQKRSVLAKGIRDAKAILNGTKPAEQKPAERKPNAA